MELYDNVSKGIFDIVRGKSRTHLKNYLTKLSNQFNVPLKQVVQDYNEYTGYEDYERIEDLGDDENTRIR